MLRKLLRSFARPARAANRNPTARRTLSLERLEDRTLLAAVPTLVAVSVSAASLTYGQSETLTATVTVVPPNTGTPTGGTVTFYVDGVAQSNPPVLVNGSASMVDPLLPAGQHSIAASYSGDGVNFAGSSTPLSTTPVIATVAGNGEFLFSGDGLAATAAELSWPTAVAVDAAGNVFLAEGSCIWEVNHSNGVITTVAGDGTGGFSGDGGPATAAELWDPTGIALDAAGDLFIAAGQFFDGYAGRIREVNRTTGVITTVAGGGSNYAAGGQATSASFAGPLGVAVSPDGRLFIADASATYGGPPGGVYAVNLSTGVIATVAGDGTVGYWGDGGPATAAELDGPKGLAVDSAGDLFIADGGNNVVREVNHSTNIITTVAGDGRWGYNGDNIPAASAELGSPTDVALDPSGKLFIADSNNGRVRAVDLSTGIISTVVGGGNQGLGDGGQATAAQLYYPAGIAFDGAGNLFIADTNDDRVREVNHATGLIATVAGGGSPGDGGQATAAELYGPSGVAVDAAGDVFIADQYNNRIREVNSFTGIITTIAGTGVPGYFGDNGQATAAELNQPTALALDASDDLFIADSWNERVREINLSTGVITTVAGNGTMGYGGDGLQATSAEIDGPEGVALDNRGDLFIADEGNGRVREVNLSTGVIATIAGDGTSAYGGDNGPATAAALFWPAGVAVDTAGNVFIADRANNRVREVNHTTGVITTVVGDGTLGDSGDNGPATAAELFYPSALAFDSVGDLFVSDNQNNRIREVNHATGMITTVAGGGSEGLGDDGPATAAALSQPLGIAFDVAGNLFIADWTDNRVRMVTPGAAMLSVTRATPNVSVTDADGTCNGSPFAAAASVAGVVAGVDSAPASTLENAGLTFDYRQLNPDGSTAADLGNTPPSAPGTYAVVATFPGSADYAAASNSATFTIWPAGATVTAGLYNPATSTFYLHNSATPGLPDTVVPFQPTSDPCIPLAGDWTDSGTAQVGLYDPTTSTFYLANSNASGTTYTTVIFQPTADACIPIVGDWTGSGATTVGLYDPKTSTFYERDSDSSGTADATFVFGPAGGGWVPLAGNWTGSGASSVGLYNPATGVFYLRDANAAGTPDVSFQFGPADSGSIPLAGDWFGGGTTTVGLYNPQTSAFSLRDSNTAGCADVAFPFGPPGSNWIPIVGDWAGAGQVVAAAATPQLAADMGDTPATAAESADYPATTELTASTTASATPALAQSSPSVGSLAAGQNAIIQWPAASVDAAGNISLVYGTTADGSNAPWIEVGGVAAAGGMGQGSYRWDTTGVAAGTHYLAGCLWDGNQPFDSQLTTSIVVG